MSETNTTVGVGGARKLFLSMFAAAISLGLSATASAIIIDDFSDGSVDISSTSGIVNTTETGLSNVIGGSRLTQVELISGDRVGALLISAIDEMSFYSDAVNSEGLFTLFYDANGAGLGGIDLTSGGIDDAIDVSASADLNSNSATISIFDTSGNSSTRTLSFDMGSILLSFAFSDFIGSADLTDVDSVQFQIDGVGSGDYGVSSIATTSEQVPEPVTLALMGLGLASIGYRKRKQRVNAE